MKNVAVSGTTAVLADHMSGVDLIDVSNLAGPVSLGSVYLDGYSRDVTVLGSLAYAVDDPSPDSTCSTCRRPTPGNPSRRSSRQTDLGSWRCRTPPPLTGRRSLSCWATDRSRCTTYPSRRHPSTNRRTPRRVALCVRPLHGNHAFVADGLEGLLVVDLENPSAPRVAGSFKPTEPVRDVAVADSLALVAVGPLPTGIGRSQGGSEVLILHRRP